MSELAWVTVIVGVLVIVARAPLIVAPERTLDAYRPLWATNGRVRALGLVVAGLAVALLVSGRDAEGDTAPVVVGLGLLILGGVAILLLGFPASYRRLADSVTGAMDPAVLRWIGVFGTLVGVGLIYLGLRVL